MPPHSSYILQPLNVSCFAALKKAYSQQIKDLIYAYVNYITKVEFLIAFKAAFFTSIIEENILKGFRKAGLKPLDLERVLQQLNVKLQTPTPTRAPLLANNP